MKCTKLYAAFAATVDRKKGDKDFESRCLVWIGDEGGDVPLR